MARTLLSRQQRADLLLLLVTAIWGGTFVMVKDAVEVYPVFSFLAIRFSLATLAFLPLLGLSRRAASLAPRDGLGSTARLSENALYIPTWQARANRAPGRFAAPVARFASSACSRLSSSAPGAGVFIGLLLFASYGLQTTGLRHTTSTKTGFITGLSVVFVPLLAALLWRRRPRPASLLGVLLAVIGLAFLTLSADLSVNRGDLLVLGCAVTLSLHIITVGAVAPRVDPLRLAAMQMLVVAMLSAAAALLWEQPLAMPSPSVWFAAAFTGLLASSFAFGAQTFAQRFTSPTHTALIFVMEPVFAALFSNILGGEALTGRTALGSVLILAGMLVAQLAP